MASSSMTQLRPHAVVSQVKPKCCRMDSGNRLEFFWVRSADPIRVSINESCPLSAKHFMNNFALDERWYLGASVVTKRYLLLIKPGIFNSIL